MPKRAKPDVRERFGDAIRQKREDLGMTQEDLAEAAKLHRTYVSDVERGARNVSLIAIEQLASGLNTRLGELFDVVDGK